MKTCLICPSPRAEVSALSKTVPLAALPMLGKSLLEYWMEHLASLGATHVQVLTADRPGIIRNIVGDGARWGLRAEVIIEPRELSPGLARTKYPALQKTDWLPEPNDLIALTHLPGLPEHQIFSSYAEWIGAQLLWMPMSGAVNRIGFHEVQPGVWVGAHARIASTAKLCAPCWIGEDVSIGARSTIGPMTIVENRSVIEGDCEISGSYVGAETLVGRFTELHDSLGLGNTLVNWKTASVATIDDPFILCSLNPEPKEETFGWMQQLASFFARTKELDDPILNLRKIKLP